ncbi:hypothetical protein HOD38_04450 [archaeon]|jgi:predicted nucleic acid-binding protein|nr:hypothetical protein [archaeon]MBT4397492.1 hypothetical protein [archaeon]MBT4440887.1 hypothetical protein [archaeon]
MKSLVFDSSTIITLAMNNLLWLLKPLRKKFRGEFYIPLSVKKEIIDTPLKSKKFKFEALQVLKVIREGDLKIYDDSKLASKTKELVRLMNKIFSSGNKDLKVLHEGEVSALVLAQELGSQAVVIDERTTRMLLERPFELGDYLKRKLHRDIFVNRKVLDRFSKEFKSLRIIRSVELGLVAYELGLLDRYIPDKKLGNEKDLLDAFLWGAKLRGCAVSVSEINSLLAIEGF